MKSVKILLVEDNDIDVLIFKKALEALNVKYELTVVKEYKEVLSFLKDDKPEIIFLDINLPDKSGIEILKESSFKASTKKIPVIMLTSMENIETINLCYTLNAKFFLPKTSSVTSLSKNLKRELVDAQLNLLFNNVEELSEKVGALTNKG